MSERFDCMAIHPQTITRSVREKFSPNQQDVEYVTEDYFFDGLRVPLSQSYLSCESGSHGSVSETSNTAAIQLSTTARTT